MRVATAKRGARAKSAGTARKQRHDVNGVVLPVMGGPRG